MDSKIYDAARALSDDFLQNDTEYRLGFVESEQPNPITTGFGEICRKSTLGGVKTLINADKRIVDIFKGAIDGEAYRSFAADVFNTLSAGGRIIISGCGSSGRLAMRLEASWRQAFCALAEPLKNKAVTADSVISLMTGGDYAVIRAVESFEDHISLGYAQAEMLDISANDILIGVTATGETTSVLGTAMAALDSGAGVWMVVCTAPDTITGRLSRADKVFGRCKALYIPCGGMAITGSTRMQSSTLEQAVIGCALEESLSVLSGNSDREALREILKNGFEQAVASVEAAADRIAECVDAEAELYRRGGHVTYFANEYLLDVLADTTERGPTFCTPAFRPQCSVEQPLSWAFVKNPLFSTVDAWEKCFGRTPRCIECFDYEALGIKTEVPKIGLNELYGFEIGFEPDLERENGESLAMWIGETAPNEYYTASRRYKNAMELKLTFSVEKTQLNLFEHLGAKMLINVFSTCVMAKMGKIYGNYMVCMSITNKKLIDRATRIVSALCNISYEEANLNIFISKLTCGSASPVKETIERLLAHANP